MKPLLQHKGDEEQVAGHDPQPGHQPQLLAVTADNMRFWAKMR